MNVGIDAPPSEQDAAAMNRIIFGNNAAMAEEFLHFAVNLQESILVVKVSSTS
jgi:hypothetical protein